MSKRVAIVTGANTGIGKATAVELAKAGFLVLVGSRSEEKGRAAVRDVIAASGSDAVEFYALDLGNFEKIKASADAFLKSDRSLDLLINNAGVAGQQGQTDDGWEIHFGTNHLGHFLFTLLLLDRLKAAPKARIVHVSSASHYQAKGIDFSALRGPTKSITGLPEYEVSKLANVLFSWSLADKLAGTNIRSYSLHPGVVASDAWRRIPWPIAMIMKWGMISNEEGAKTTLHCALSDEAGKESGLFYDKSKVRTPSKPARDAALRDELWRRSLEWTGFSTDPLAGS